MGVVLYNFLLAAELSVQGCAAVNRIRINFVEQQIATTMCVQVGNSETPAARMRAS